MHRALKLAESDAGRFEEGQVEGDVVGDDAGAVEEIEDAGADAVQIDDEDAIAAGVDLKQSDVGAARIESCRPGVPDLGGEALPSGDARRDLGRRGFELASGFCRPAASAWARISSARRSTSVLSPLGVDRDPIRREHFAEKAARCASSAQ